ncbi:MAG: OmpA family protein [Rickettsiales bacterium]
MGELRFFFKLLIFFFLAACASDSTLLTPNDKYFEFKKQLAENYRKYALWEFDENNNQDASALFGEKSLALSNNEMVHPIKPEEWRNVPLSALPELKRARSVLMAIFSHSYWSYEKNPKVSAAAQLYYDCWVEQKTTKNYWTKKSPCRSSFYQTIQMLMQTIASKENFLSYASSVHSIYFSFDGDEIEEASIPRINMLIRQLRKVRDVELVMYGYTDRVGRNKYNRNLAEERLRAVVEVINNSGVMLGGSNISIKTKAFGENDPLISPQTVVNNPHSRRVDIFIVKK